MSSTLPAVEASFDLTAVRPATESKAIPPAPRSSASAPVLDRLFGWAAKGAALLTLSLLVAILGSLVGAPGLPSRPTGWAS